MINKKQGKELDMDLINKISHLNGRGFSQNRICNTLGISKGSANKYIKLLDFGGAKEKASEPALEKPVAKSKSLATLENCGIDFAEIDKELAKKGVTLKLLHAELSFSHPSICSYSNFCYLHRKYKESQDVCLRQHYKGGEIMYVDYSGLTVKVADFEAEIFVGVLAASNYIYVEATRDQKLTNWIDSHRHAFEFYGGVPQIVVIDNLKSGVTKADKFKPLINRSYSEFILHYNSSVIPARAYSPRDKGKVEVAVQIVQREILAKLRHEKFNNLSDLNHAIRNLLKEVNSRKFQKSPGCRYDLFKELDSPYLISLPDCPYEYAEYEKQIVAKDYHVYVNGTHYSVPYTHVRKTVEIKKLSNTIEILYKGQRIAIHQKQLTDKNIRYITDQNHLPEKHRSFVQCKPEDIIVWAKANFSHGSIEFIEQTLKNCNSSLAVYKKSGSIKQLAKKYGVSKMDKALLKLTKEGVFSIESLESMLAKSLESASDEEQNFMNIVHTNLRGSDYYNQQLAN